MRVLIAGAGPTGLSAGVELARRGTEVEIIDRKETASALSRAVGINPQSLELLTPSGVTNELLARGVQYRSVEIYRGAAHWATLPLTAAPVRHGYNIMLGLPQDQTEAILREKFVELGGRVRFGTGLAGFEQDSDGITAQTDAGEKIRADYLVGADGIRSTVREAAGIAIEYTDLPGQWSIADVEVAAWPHPNAATLCLLRGGWLAAVIPLGGKRLRLISNTTDALSAQTLDIEVTQVHREGQFQVALSQVREYSRGRAFLAGDAAHSQSPAGGRGMNLGIADACDLAARLTGGDLAGYSGARHAEGARVIAGSETLRRTVTSASPLKHFGMLGGFKAISMFPALQRRFAERFLYG